MSANKLILEIENLKIRTFIGVHAWEKQIEQLLLVTVSLSITNLKLDDNIHSTIDYAKTCEDIKIFFKNNNFNLIETAATKLAKYLQEKNNIDSCKIKISKPAAILDANNVSVFYEI